MCITATQCVHQSSRLSVHFNSGSCYSSANCVYGLINTLNSTLRVWCDSFYVICWNHAGLWVCCERVGISLKLEVQNDQSTWLSFSGPYDYLICKSANSLFHHTDCTNTAIQRATVWKRDGKAVLLCDEYNHFIFFLIKVTVREISKAASQMTPPSFSFYLDPLQSNKGKKKAKKKALKTRKSPVWNTLRFAWS